MNKKILRMSIAGCCLLLMSATIFIVQGAVIRNDLKVSPTPVIIPTPSPEKTWTEWLDPDSPALKTAYYIQQLDDDKRAICNGLYQGLLSFKKEIELPEPMDKELISELMRLIRYDCPELFHIGAEYSYFVRPDEPDKVVLVSPVYSMTESEYLSALRETEAVIEEWKHMTLGMDAFSTQKFIYDSLMEKCEYLEEGAHTGTAYGALVLGKARCEGYAQALNFALRQAGMDCVMLTGDAKESRVDEEEGTYERIERHAWNASRIGGAFYQLDATWDDSDGQLSCGSAYAYFNVTDEEMAGSRTLDAIYEKLDVPVCNSLAYNYFVQTGKYIDATKSTRDILIGMLNNMRDEGKTSVLGKLETKEQFFEFNEYFRDWMAKWGGDNNYTSGTYNLIMYPDSRVFCLSDVVFK